MSIQRFGTNVHSSFICNSQKSETIQCPSINRWIVNKLWSIHTEACYSAIKQNDLLIRDTTWVNLKVIRLNERSQILLPHKGVHSVISFM